MRSAPGAPSDAGVLPCLGFATFDEVLGSCRELQNKVLVSIALGKPHLSCLQQDPATVRFAFWILSTLQGPVNRPKPG